MTTRTASRRAAVVALTGAAPAFAALGDPTRLRLVARFTDDGPQSIAALGRGLPLTRQGLTKHLRVMEEAGLVVRERHGREHEWRLAPDRLAHLGQLLERIAADWAAALALRQEFVEGV